MIRRILLSLVLVSSAQMATAIVPDTSGGTFVKVEASFAHATLPRGAGGEILFRLIPAEGIHVNATPALEFRLEQDSVVSCVGTPIIKRNAKGYVDLGVPVRQRIAITRYAAPGDHTVKGTFIFYYCSDAEGWCMRGRQALELTLRVGN